ncbi:hypothetical protein B0T18DRAFT_411742 [Schizothecium vesticola]|uniref:Sister chromatid cohesion protein DCC1 n=1 Tax=Schizothecium vesticola TaxID=314040 RepID=A0AA40EVY5_9PEZI|nr:hypothetical protein B0T18DRAFT_411742 [Schizothecium vesticola]
MSRIPLYHAPRASSLHGYKLLELPDELLALLESDDPPTLTLTPSSTVALLKTPGPAGKTYSLRQKNTSNALILLESVSVPVPVPPGQQQQNQGGATVALRAFATVHETVELVPEAGDVPAVAKRGKWHEKFAKGR